MKIDELKVGMSIDNKTLADTFLCSTQGGMRRSLRTNTLVLISDQTKVYADRWDGDVLLYTGMGLTGDQDFYYMQNRTLYESQTNGVAIHLFEVFQPRQYTYIGQVELAGKPYMEKQADQNDLVRLVCVFPVRGKK